ncbi:MAG: peptidylprolyl isomerase FKBP-type [Chlorobi bacterium]|nr:peptidylprolyl isomerase FKBP-type [Chlorobiota bacterium]
MKRLALLTLALGLLALTARAGGLADGDTITTASGLKYIITHHGAGTKAAEGNVVLAHYTGTFLDGKVFDSSRERNEPFAFTLGRHQVIRGWDEGFGLLRVGDRATLIIPPGLAYGNMDRGPIPANSTLIFDVELVDLKSRSVADEVEKALEAKGIDGARAAFGKEKRSKDSYLSEAQMNSLGYKLLNAKRIKEAIAILQLNADAFPKSANVYDSLGEAFMAGGNAKLATANYRKSLELNPQNTNATDMLKKLKAK